MSAYIEVAPSWGSWGKGLITHWQRPGYVIPNFPPPVGGSWGTWGWCGGDWVTRTLTDWPKGASRMAFHFAPLLAFLGWGRTPLLAKGTFPPIRALRGKVVFVDCVGKTPLFCLGIFECMRWLTAHEVREIFREVLGWEVHPNTLRVWSRTGKLRSVVSPGRGRTFYPIEEVAKVLGLEPTQVAAIVQKEKGGQP